MNLLTLLLLAGGVFFFVAGSVGLLRFRDVHSRLHALTKADNLGLGLIVLAAGLHGRDPWQAGKLLLVWALAMLAAATAAQLVARSALVHGDDAAPETQGERGERGERTERAER